MLAFLNAVSLFQREIGPHDVSQMSPGDLSAVAGTLDVRGWTAILTLRLDGANRADQTALVRHFGESRHRAELAPIVGFGIDGGGEADGEPGGDMWAARCGLTADGWREVADLGRYGLRYVILPAHRLALSREVAPGFTFADLLTLLYDHGVLLALPSDVLDADRAGWRRCAEAIDMVQQRHGPAPSRVLTAPLRWPSASERPAAVGGLIRAARAGTVTPCLTMDPELAHPARQADLARLIGPDRTVVCPDGGYDHRGIVQQVRQLRLQRFTEDEIESMVCDVPRAMLAATLFGRQFLQQSPPRLPTALRRRDEV